MNICNVFSLSISELIHSPKGTHGFFLVDTPRQAESIMQRVGSAACLYGTKYKTESFQVINQDRVQRLVVVTIIKAGRGKKKLGRKPKQENQKS